ncbi:SARP family transcriptional regulator [Actinorhabdospora filicis]|uniref:SARP family transcriptional regulator n=2 Tax=Actinorhabdospora filicis TaxID=1785913 RepID=A0A9W6WA18_9ACTN|nr:SARP family transcriptional regulator [Actinorhabdospora filicis]
MGGRPVGERLELSLLGPLRARFRGELLDLGPVRQQAVLAALVLRPDTIVDARRLLDDVWGDEPPASGLGNLASYVYRLRQRVPMPVLVTESGGYRFLADRVRVDAAWFRHRLAEARASRDAGDLEAAVGAYGEAIGLFAGEPLAGVPGPFAEAQRARLTDVRLRARREKLECQLGLGRHVEAAEELAELVEEQPFSEVLAVLLMRALHAGGGRAEAMAVFTRLRQRLSEELGVEPGGEAQRAYRELLTAVERQAPPRDELPADHGDLVGRERELAVLAAPGRPDVVTVRAVDGVAGVGKTALVVQAARSLREAIGPDHCLFVDLHGYTEGRDPADARTVLRRLLRAIGADDAGIPDDIDELAATWRSAGGARRIVLVLDNAADAEQVRPLLPSGPGSHVLVSGRARLLGLDVPVRVSLEPLAPGDAAALLTAVIGEARSGSEPEAVARLAALCDHLPLAVRLAAARLQSRPMWTVAEFVERLADDRSRLGELRAGNRSVAAALGLSYRQLPVEERTAFGAFGWFPAAELDVLVAAALLGRPARETERVLENLVDANLLRQPASGRYRMHDLVAAYAGRLPEPAGVEAARARALSLYLSAARRASDEGPAAFPTGPEGLPDAFADIDAADAWLSTMSGVIVEAIAHPALAAHPDHVCWIAEALLDHFTRSGAFHEARTVLSTALAVVGRATDARMVPALPIRMGIALGMQGRYGESEDWLRRGLVLARSTGEPREQARALGALGTVTRSLGRDEEAVTHLTEVLDLAGRLDDDWLRGMALCNLGAVHQGRGATQAALDCFNDAVALAERVGAPRVIGKSLCYTAGLHLELGHHAEAAAQSRRAAGLAERAGDQALLAFALTRLGSAEQGLGRLDEAIDAHRRALGLVTEQSSVETEIEIRERLGAALHTMGRIDQARAEYARILDLTVDGSFPERRAAARDGLDRCEP